MTYLNKLTEATSLPWFLSDTGGGCLAYEVRLSERDYILLTIEGDADVPTDESEPVTIGLYRESKNGWDMLEIENAPDLAGACDLVDLFMTRSGAWRLVD